jgi:hypothetical protein
LDHGGVLAKMWKGCNFLMWNYDVNHVSIHVNRCNLLMM